MPDTPASTPFQFRRWLLRLAWILLAVSLFIPPPAGSFPGDKFGVSAFYVYERAVLWSEALPGSPASLGFWRDAVLALALFSNFLFLFVPLMLHVRDVSMAWKGILLIGLAIDACVVLVVPELSRLPAYWMWLAAIAALATAFVVFQGDDVLSVATKRFKGRAPLDRGEVTQFFWALLSVTLGWLGVSAAGYVSQSHEGGATAGGVPLATYVTDRASVLKQDQGEQLTRTLTRYANDTSTQIAVAIYPRAPQGSIDDFTIGVADRSHVGLGGLDNGAILFLFMQERAARLEVGYGLESTITDVVAHRVLDAHLAPAFAGRAYYDGIDETLHAVFDVTETARKEGLDQGRPANWKQKTKSGLRKMIESPLLALSQIGLLQRAAITFLGGIVVALFWQGIRQWLLLARDVGRGVRNVLAHRPYATGMEAVDMDQIGSPLALFVMLLAVFIPTAGFLALAAGGTFGGAGALIHW
jgi:uncharacterized membrane protein YgcG